VIFGRQARPDDKYQDPFPLKMTKYRLSVPIFLLQSQQKGFPLQSLPQYIRSKRLSFSLHFDFSHFGTDVEKY